MTLHENKELFKDTITATLKILTERMKNIKWEIE